MAEYGTMERRTSNNPIASVLYMLFTLLAILLIARFGFLLLGANPANGFVEFVYALSNPFVAPFRGIFNGASPGTGVVVNSIFDVATLVALVVYSLLGWALAMPFRRA